MARFVCLRWAPGAYAEGARAAKLAERLADGWRRLVEWRGVIVLYKDQAPATPVTVLARNGGVIFGWLFETPRDEAPAPVARLSSADELAAAESGGASLMAACWGGYLAILVDHARDHVHVVRDPSGAIACHFGRIEGIRIAFTDAADFAALGGALDLDERRLCGFLLQPRLSMQATGIRGVTELRPGEAMTFMRDSDMTRILWRPHDPKRGCIHDFKAAQAALRSCVRACVGAWGAVGAAPILRLSGGLDSSLVLASLMRAVPGRTVKCVNEYSPTAPEGDERLYARAAAAFSGQTLWELEMRPEEIRYENVRDAPLFASPVRSSLDWANRDFARRLSALDGDIVLSGQGGDHVFHRTRTPLIAADAARSGMGWRGWRSIALATARVSGRSVWEVAAASAKHGVLRAPFDLMGHWRAARPLIGPAVDAQVLRDFAEHPWLDGWRKLPAGQAQRIALLIDALHYQDPTLMRTRMNCVTPLLSQPIVELALRIPPHLMTHDGRDRALVRAAFAEDLPDMIGQRATKGETSRYFAAAIAANANTLRDMLMHGRLQQMGFIDRAGLERALRPDAAAGDGARDLLTCLAAEAWVEALERARTRVRSDGIA